ncbi:MAG: hypothetical protein AUK43_18275 [Oscillatoriales cyanobacterium CG2_30_40_61]|nr:MAG: hypothetical protein AUK43_18275 [Oscillatoriales cyanobacterium CG2_30_40_61]
MQLEQQQRIMGYFIEEAKDHLNTIEQGLLNLQTTIEDPELLNEVFRAAHSVKGGAAMLGLNSIQQTAHRLEDSFKILKDNRLPTQFIDQQLESLFLQVFDTLQALIDQLSGPYGLTEEAASAILQDVEPVFEALNYHIKNVVQQQGTKRTSEVATRPVGTTPPRTPAAVVSSVANEPPSSARDLVFRSDVPERLREMLQQFKQSETSRKGLIEICQSLARAGELFDLPHWVKFIETLEAAIANPDNTYRSLAPIVIKSIKAAQELVLVNREAEIVVTEAIKKLLPKTAKKSQFPSPQSSPRESKPPKNVAKSSVTETEKTKKPGKSKQESPKAATKTNPLSDVNWSDSVTNPSNNPPTRLQNGPEITTEEYNSLRDLFEGLDEWEKELPEEVPLSTSPSWETETDDLSGDIIDLLGDGKSEVNQPASSSPSPTQKAKTKQKPGLGTSGIDDDLGSLFDHLSDGESVIPETPNPTRPAKVEKQQQKQHDPVESFGNLFDEFLEINPQEEVPSANSASTSTERITELLEDAENLDYLFDQFDPEIQSGREIASGSSDQINGQEDWFEGLLQGEVEEATDGIPDQPSPPQLPQISPRLEPVATVQPALELPEDDFASLDALLNLGGVDSQPAAEETTVADEDFLDLDQLLHTPVAEPLTPDLPKNIKSQTARKAVDTESQLSEEDSEFNDLIRLIEDAPPRSRTTTPARGTFAKPIAEQIVKVPVKQLDGLSNLMGELVVNRNTLEQDQERMRQFLDNLLHQVSLLGDVGQRMQDFYERSLLEISLLSHRRKPFWFSDNASIHDDDQNNELDSTELDRFTPFHTLSQEIIELIVRVRESSADIGFLVEEADQVTRELRRITTALQEGLNRSRMEPFGSEADALKRPVRDISIKCGKQAELFVEGRDTLIDKMLLGKLHDPLIHLVNNAITHGIETADVRTAAGKSAVGRIMIRVFHQGNQTIIAVSDDGGGIDVNRVKDKAIQKGIITAEEAETMSNPEIYDLLFLPNFSTKDVADEFAGRGVGMDVVRTSLTDIRGAITTDSTLGKGTSFTIRLPLNMSISRALACVSDRVRIAFPMDGVEDMIDVPREQIRTESDGGKVLEWRGTMLPLRHLRELLTYHRHLGRGNVYGSSAEEDMVSVIVLRSSNSYLAVQVDQVLIEQEIVIKPLEGPVPKPIGIAGATVLGDGQIVAIADVLELIDLAMGRIRRDASGKIWQMGDATAQPQVQKSEPTVLIVDDSITVRSLLSITFEKSGYRVEEARDGKEAWEKLKSGLPCDIVFCDIEMPRMDGLELLSRMQKDPALTDLPIAMLTSRGADRHRQMAFNLGARGYFTKPYLEEQLLEAAGRMLNGEVVGNTVTITG